MVLGFDFVVGVGEQDYGYEFGQYDCECGDCVFFIGVVCGFCIQLGCECVEI